MQRSEAEAIYRAGCEAVVETLLRLDRDVQRLSERLLPYARRSARDRRLSMQATGHVDYYRAIMRSDIQHGPEAAVGSGTRDSWLASGRIQFDYLLSHDLKPTMRMLDIGCGNLRAGRLFIDHLEPGNYHGIDISPEILLAALETIGEFRLQAKLPRLTLVRDLKLDFLPYEAFDVVHAHSVFTHSPLEVIDECLQHVGRIMAPDAFFDFTFHATAGRERQVLGEDFYYRRDKLITLAAKHGLDARPMDDWEQLPHKQSKLRMTRARPQVRASEATAG